jgi:hypothetical protein
MCSVGKDNENGGLAYRATKNLNRNNNHLLLTHFPLHNCAVQSSVCPLRREEPSQSPRADIYFRFLS